MAERATGPPLPCRAQRFGCVLNDHKAVLRRDREQRHHIDRMSEDVDRNDGAKPPAGLLVHQLTVAANRYLVQMRIQRRRIEAQRIPAGIDDMRDGPGMADGIGGRDERDRRQDDFIVCLDALEEQRCMKRRGAVDDGDGVTGPGGGCDHLLELADIFAGRRHPVGVDAIEHQFALARAQPRFVEPHRTGCGRKNGIDRFNNGIQIELGAAVGNGGRAAHQAHRL